MDVCMGKVLIRRGKTLYANKGEKLPSSDKLCIANTQIVMLNFICMNKTKISGWLNYAEK